MATATGVEVGEDVPVSPPVLGGRVTAVGTEPETGARVTPAGTGGIEVEISPPDGGSETKSLGRSLGISEPIP